MDILMLSRRVGAPKWIRILGLVKLGHLCLDYFIFLAWFVSYLLTILFTLFFLFFSIDDEDERNSYRSFDNGMFIFYVMLFYFLKHSLILARYLLNTVKCRIWFLFALTLKTRIRRWTNINFYINFFLTLIGIQKKKRLF